MPYFDDQDWFEMHIPVWREHLTPILDSPVRALEVGSYEGRSALWMMENFHPESYLTCIDTWDGKDVSLGERTVAAEKNFDLNMQPYRDMGRIGKLKGRSFPMLSTLYVNHLRNFDLIYLDGDHEGLGALTDLCLCWPLLKSGGYLVFDDYRLQDERFKVLPKEAWDAFAAMKPGFEMVHQFRQCIVRKI